MTDNALRSLINRLRWDPHWGDQEAVLIVRERVGGVPSQAVIAVSEVVAVSAHGCTTRDGTFLPFHRVLEVRQGATVLFPLEGVRTHAT